MMLGPEHELHQAEAALAGARRANGGIGFDGKPTYERLHAEARVDLARARVAAERDPLVREVERVRLALAHGARRRDPLLEALAAGFLTLAEQATAAVTQPVIEARARLEQLEAAEARRMARREAVATGTWRRGAIPIRARQLSPRDLRRLGTTGVP